MKPLPKCLFAAYLTPALLLLLLVVGGCTAVSEEDGEYTPPALPASSIGRMRPDANPAPGQQ